MIKNVHIFSGSMDMDSEDHLMSPEDYRLLLNGHNDITIKRGIIRNVKSNILINNPFLQAGKNMVIGEKEDIAGGSSLYLVWNQGGHHALFRYFRTVSGYPMGRIEKILMPRNPAAYTLFNEHPLNFSDDPEHLITGINLVDNYLTFTDNNVRSKMIDIVRANETGKRRKFHIIFNRNNFGFNTTYTLLVWATGGGIPGLIAWNSLTNSTLQQRIDDFLAAYSASPLVNLFTAKGCKGYVEIEMVQEGGFVPDIDDYAPQLYLANYLSNINAVPLRLSVFFGNPGYVVGDVVFISGFNNNPLIVGARTITAVPSPGVYEFAQIMPANSLAGSGTIEKLPLAPATYQSMVVPDNFYPDEDLSIPPGISYDPMSRDLIDELVYTPLYCPVCKYETDVTRQINLVKNRLFQFRTRIRYFDNSWSVYGAVSKIAIPVRSCGENNYGNNNNYILVDFSDPRLENRSLVSIIQNVELAVNEPALDEVWKTVKVFERHEIAGNGQATFKFYNDGNYPAIAAALITRAYDALFIKYKSKELGDDRNFTGGGVEGYPKPCSKVEVKVNYDDEAVVTGRYSVSGRYLIKSAYYAGVNGQPYPDQIVWKQTIGQPAQYGGFFEVMTGHASPGSTGPYQQGLPSGGFICYLAGTNYYAITKQEFTGLHPSTFGLTIDPTDGAIIFVPSGQGMANMHNYLTYLFNNPNHCEQRFSIQNVAAGRYIFRTASPLLTPLELITGIGYQRTSMDAYMFFNTDTEAEVVVSNANIVVPDWNITDLCDPLNEYAVIQGYVTGNDIATPPVTPAEFLADTRIDLALIGAALGGGGTISSIDRTDHNGFFSFPYHDDTIDLQNVQTGAYTVVPASNIDVSGAAWSPVNPGELKIGVFRVTDVNVKQYARTKLTGNVLNSVSGDPSIGTNVVNTHGGQDYTDPTGEYGIYAYAPAPGPRRADAIILSAGDLLCQYSFYQDKIPYDIHISNVAGDYNDANVNPNWYEVVDVLVTVLIASQSVSALKRGGDYQLGIVYFDEGDRRCAVVPCGSIHITFYTEKDENGILQKTGMPRVSWKIFHEPPSWAVKYQWVITSNLQLNNYLQWISNVVTYVDEDDNTVPHVDGVFAKINLDNIGWYTTKKYPDSIITYTFVKGDRIRLRADINGVPYGKYYDFEILKDDGGSSIYIYALESLNLSNGFIFEIYTPKGINPNNLYFEFGECFLVKDAFFNGVHRKYHEGPQADQAYGPLPLQTVTPAEGEFTSGDVYYRLRLVPYNVPPSGVGAITQKLINIDDQSVSDFYQSKAPGFGRPHVESPDIDQVQSPTAIRPSNPYISGTKINGLRNFEPGNRMQLSTDYGLINKFKIVDDTVLKAFCANSVTVSMYVHKGVIKTATVQTFIAVSDDILSNQQKNQRTFGTVNPESVHLNDQGDIFYWDENKSIISRSSGNGLIPVSAYKMISEFNRVGTRRRLLKNKNSKAVGTYHVDRDLYIISFNPLDPFPGEKPTVKFPAPFIDTGMQSQYTVSPLLQVFVMPLNILLCNAPVTDANYPDTGKMIEANINLGTAVHGWTASLDKEGFVRITAPTASDIYSNNEIVVRLNYKDTAGLQDLHTDINYILSQAVLPSQETVAFEGETFAFCKDKNGWTEKYNIVPEYWGRIKGEILSFADGNLYLHEAGADYNNFFGQQFNRRLDYVTAGDKDLVKMKQFKAMEVNSKIIHYCPEIRIPADQQKPIGMLSKLYKTNFKLQQGRFYSDLLRDQTTPGFIDPLKALLNGRPLVGQVLRVWLENDSNTEAELLECQTLYFYSEVS